MLVCLLAGCLSLFVLFLYKEKKKIPLLISKCGASYATPRLRFS